MQHLVFRYCNINSFILEFIWELPILVKDTPQSIGFSFTVRNSLARFVSWGKSHLSMYMNMFQHYPWSTICMHTKMHAIHIWRVRSWHACVHLQIIMHRFRRSLRGYTETVAVCRIMWLRITYLHPTWTHIPCSVEN